MLACVVFAHVICCAGKEISQEEGVNSLIPSSTMVLGWLSVSDVINFRLEQVIIPSWLCSEVVCAACLMDYYFYARLRCMLSFEYIISRAQESIQQTEQRNSTVR